MLERIQRRGTKVVKYPMDTLYGDRLKLINLLLLSYRRFRVDLVLA